MKTKTKLFAIAVIGLSSVQVFAQKVSRWDVGFSTKVGIEHFSVKTIQQGNEGRESFNSDYALSGGFWAERRFGARFSAVSDLNYFHVKSSYNVFTGGMSKDNYGDIMENHSYASIDGKGRVYFAEKSNRKLFAEAGLKLDRMLLFKNSVRQGENKVWNPKNLDQLNTGLLIGFGCSIGRWRIFGEYQHNLGTSFSKNYRDIQQNMGVETKIGRQSYLLGTSFALSKVR